VKTAVVAVVLVTVHIGTFAAVFQQLEFKNKARTDAAAMKVATFGFFVSNNFVTAAAAVGEANGVCVQS